MPFESLGLEGKVMSSDRRANRCFVFLRVEAQAVAGSIVSSLVLIINYVTVFYSVSQDKLIVYSGDYSMTQQKLPKYWETWKGRVIRTIAKDGEQTFSELQKKTGLAALSLNRVIG